MKRTCPSSRHLAVSIVAVSFLCNSLFGQGARPTTLAPVVVTATRAAQPVRETPFAVDVFGPERFSSSPASTIDDVLRESAAFSLFRRSSALYANPTAQGVSLRGIGPSGASRSLILLDGVPLNDPFGGWIAWNKIPRESLIGAEIVRGGGSGAWGNAALGGVIQLFTTASEDRSPRSGRVAISAGEFGMRSAEIASVIPTDAGTFQIAARGFETDGFHALASDDRGPIDQPLSSRHELLAATWGKSLNATTTATVTGRWFEEERGNGTPLQQNSSREGFVSLALQGTPVAGPHWQMHAYFQRQSFDSFFSAVNATRTGETPANHQFDVPADAVGAAWSGTWTHAGSSTTAGADLRQVKGATAEHFFFSGSSFTRVRRAGGEQRFAGMFFNHERAPKTHLRISGGARLDLWQNSAGFRTETDRTSGAVLRDDHYPDDDGFEISPRLGAVWLFDEQWRLRASAYRAFRVPTLNEFHRPFRVGIISTEANPALERETLDGAEIGVEYSGAVFGGSVTVFSNRLSDAVGNVTLSRTPSAITRQRQNIDRISVTGLEVRGEWRPVPGLRISADWLYNDAEVESAAAQPALAGQSLAQVPRNTVTLGIVWQPIKTVTISARGRHVSMQFEDDENQFPLAAATSVDVLASWQWRPTIEFFGAVENLTNERMETGRSNEGIVSYGMPRNLRAGVRWTF